MNWDSLDELKLMRSKIDKRINELEKSKTNPKKSHIDVFDSCNRIYNTSISHLYENKNFDNNSDYYVYAHCNPLFKLNPETNGKIAFASTLGLTHIPFYVGKGKLDRAYDLNRNESHRKIRQIIESSKKEIVVKIIKNSLSEMDALSLESKLIDIFGLKSYGGWLINLDEGINHSQRRKLYIHDFLNINKMLKRFQQ